ncbi:hypothetical protein ABR39_03985 [Enterobacter genomosp. O]|uniref:HNH endonuclease signature motif containing protein n=1 Tax=Enterobacter genomosp. O TaxID=2364150 RepID=UPI0006431638|nr:HNH endonuclease signature motif containing protein [Enterobacter genomosp. O]KLP57400.1 hypothetical protein ABR39_03985 [Enterobacter genomosp. O]
MNWHELFRYDDGKIYWNIRRSGVRYGKSPNKTTTQGYLTVIVDGKQLLVHRIIYEMHHGEIPNGHEIDHIDGDKKNNNIDNLRAVSRAVNSRNKRKLTGNTSGVTGVDFLKRRNEWRARFANTHLGWFPDFPSACEARIIAEVRSGDVTGRHGT